MKATTGLILPIAALLTCVCLIGISQEQRRAGRGAPRPDRLTEPFAATTLPKDEWEKKIVDVLNDMRDNQRVGSMSVPEQDGRILRVLVESLGAKHVVEIGTSVGYSAVWMGLGLVKTGGKLTTFEINPERAARARENFKQAGLDNIITVVLGDAHQKVKELKEPIDLLFLDADKTGYLDYLEKLLPLLRPGGLAVAHNITPYQADPRYIMAITTNPALETVFLNQETSGISITLKKR